MPREGIAILVFSACIVISVYLVTKMSSPTVTTDYLPCFVVLVFVVGWFLRKDLGKGVICQLDSKPDSNSSYSFHKYL